MNFVVCGTN